MGTGSLSPKGRDRGTGSLSHRRRGIRWIPLLYLQYGDDTPSLSSIWRIHPSSIMVGQGACPHVPPL